MQVRTIRKREVKMSIDIRCKECSKRSILRDRDEERQETTGQSVDEEVSNLNVGETMSLGMINSWLKWKATTLGRQAQGVVVVVVVRPVLH